MSQKKKPKHIFSEEYIKAHRTFPVGQTVLLVLLVFVQICAILFAVFYVPQPQDTIRDYRVTVVPRDDGSLDITYDIQWKALDDTEPLTWVQIGMANGDFSVYHASLSANILRASREIDGDYTALRLDFRNAYLGGEELTFSFTVNQRRMLCSGASGYFYEFVPGWFNATPVENYTFRWLADEDVLMAEGAVRQEDYYTWSGSLPCGGYRTMYVRYAPEAFAGQETVYHTPFDGSGAYDELTGDKAAFAALMVLVVAAALVAELYIVDSYVSYQRGRGFLIGYGHHVHLYGRSNPQYIRERDRRAATAGHGRGFGGGGGCACACACACAGGGRAGCSQKDTYGTGDEKAGATIP